MQQILSVNISDNNQYLIDISDNGFEDLNSKIMEAIQDRPYIVVISKKVYKLYAKKLDFLDSAIFIMPDGEKEKNYTNYLKIIRFAEKSGLTRNGIIVAVGGGVVGDIAGFAASTYMRGIDFIQVPTTLLAAVDSSVGGKTAIDLEDAKNIIGTFYQPKNVFININFFKTLDKKQIKSGLGEIIKYSLIEDSCGYESPLFLYEFLTLACEKVLQLEPVTIIRVIDYCLKLKIAVVTKDEKESGLRKILNLGHTLAHALETITKYKKYTHGEAVVYGLYFIFEWAYSKDYITYSYYKRTTELLDKYGFHKLKIDKNIQKLICIMQKDKKAYAEKVVFVVPYGNKKVKTEEVSLDCVEDMFLQGGRCV